MKRIKNISFLLAVILLATSLFGCGKKDSKKIIDVIQEAEVILINGVENTTLEAAMGAFQGKQGDYIEFRFSEPQTFNTVFITEKTATVRQFNIYAETDGKYALIYTGKVILQENISIDTVTADALKLEIVNTQIGNDNFIIQGVSAYNIVEEA